MDRLRTHLSQKFLVRASHELAGDPGLHGHSYEFYLTTEGLSKDELIRLGRENIVHRLDKQFLNNIFEHTSGEFLCFQLYKKIEAQIGEKLIRVGLLETKKNSFYYGR